MTTGWMDSYYSTPWSVKRSTYRNSANGGFIADVYRQTGHSDKISWMAVATVMSYSPELAAIA